MSTGSTLRAVPPRLIALVAFLLSAGLMLAAQQPPKKGGEEEEEPKAKQVKKVGEEEEGKGTVKKKVVVDDSEPKRPTGTPPDTRLDELVRAAAEAKHASLKEFITRYAVPFDRITDRKGTASRIRPIPLHRTDRFPPSFGVTELDAKNTPLEARNVTFQEVGKIDAFEELALLDAEAVLKYRPLGTSAGPDGLDPEAQLAAAEVVLAGVLRFHDYARDSNKRQGQAWEGVRRSVSDRLREIRLKQLQRATTAADWLKARDFGTKLLNNYPKNPEVMQVVGAARVSEAELLLKSKNHVDFVRAKELLDEFEAKAPGGAGEAGRKIRDQLSREAVRQFEYAKEKKGVEDLVAARDALRKAESLDPSIPGLRDLQRDLKTGYSILYVGVRQFPEKMSPATAKFDSEKQAVELLFEGLVEEIPDDQNGARYRPGAALGLPRIVPGGREIVLRATERSGPNNREGFDAHDVIGTLKMLRTRPDTWLAAGLPWLEDLPAPKTSGTIRMGFRQGHPDPRSLLTFKLLPARWMLENGKTMEDEGFAARPHGTGPFRVHAITPATPTHPRELVFLDNPAYGKWTDRTGLPHIREIRFVEYGKLLDPLTEIKHGRMHIIQDVPTGDLDRYLSPSSGLAGKVQLVNAGTNRRVYMLAVNHRRPALQNKGLRQGLMRAIDRDAILHDVFRANRIEYHKQLTGPFPPASWATTKGPGGIMTPLVDRNLATVRIKEYLNNPSPKMDFTLAYPEGDPLATAACERIKAQIEGLVQDAPGGRKLVIKLDPLPRRELIRRVEEEGRYDLAYVPFDYPDDWHPLALAAMLDPTAATRGGRNVFGYGTQQGGADDADMGLCRRLNELRAYRDFSEIVRRVKDVEKEFNDNVPFIPLWQLDRHMLVSTNLRMFDDESPLNARTLNQTTLFGGIARWRLE